MEETTGQLMTGAGGGNVPATDPDKTLVQPRFDVREERTAQPVVPLAQPPARGGRLGSSSLPVVLILVSAVVGGLVSVLAYRAYQPRPAQPTAQEQQQQQQPAAEASAEASPTPELVVLKEDARPVEQPSPSEETETDVAETVAPDAVAGGRVERAAVREERKPEATPERAPRRADDGARPERARADSARARRVDVITGPTGERVSRRERARDDSEIEGEATDYEVRAARRAQRRAARRAGRRNVDRVRAIFEGDPPRLD